MSKTITDTMRANAADLARRISEKTGSTPFPANDEDNGGAPCVVAWEGVGSAIVVYCDDPGAQISTSNRPGRFSRTA